MAESVRQVGVNHPNGNQDAMNGTGRLLTCEQVAELLNVKLDRIYEAVKDQRLRAVKIGRLLRFRPKDIEAFIERNVIR